MYLGKYLLLKFELQKINVIFLEHLNNLRCDPQTNIFVDFFFLNKDMCLGERFCNVFLKASSVPFHLTLKPAILAAPLK